MKEETASTCWSERLFSSMKPWKAPLSLSKRPFRNLQLHARLKCETTTDSYMYSVRALNKKSACTESVELVVMFVLRTQASHMSSFSPSFTRGLWSEEPAVSTGNSSKILQIINTSHCTWERWEIEVRMLVSSWSF